MRRHIYGSTIEDKLRGGLGIQKQGSQYYV